MSGLTDFLLARISEDEERAAAIHDAWDDKYDTGPRDADCACGVPARVLAECEAKRRIVEELRKSQRLYDVLSDDEDDQRWEYLFRSEALTFAAKSLALPYADHPDFRGEWRA